MLIKFSFSDFLTLLDHFQVCILTYRPFPIILVDHRVRFKCEYLVFVLVDGFDKCRFTGVLRFFLCFILVFAFSVFCE